MAARGLFRSVPRTIALLGVLPFLLLMLWFTAHVAQKNRAVAAWPQVLAQVVSVQDGRVTLQFLWHGDVVRGDVKQEYAFAKVEPLDTLTLLANPADPAQLSSSAFGDVWAGTVALGLVSGFLAMVFVAMLWAGAPRVPGQVARDVQRMRETVARNDQGSDLSAGFGTPADSALIELHEPRQSWKANVFWGLAVGLPAVVPVFFAAPGASVLDKYGITLLGIAWLAFMLGSAWRNHGRSVTCDLQAITVSQAFRPMRILLADVQRVVREDVRQQMRDLENIGVSRYDRMRRLDTRARTIVYALYDANGKTLLRLDEAMEPAPAMQRLLRRLESIAGPIAGNP